MEFVVTTDNIAVGMGTMDSFRITAFLPGTQVRLGMAPEPWLASPSGLEGPLVIRVFHDEEIWSWHLLFDSKLGKPGALCAESALINYFCLLMMGQWGGRVCAK